MGWTPRNRPDVGVSEESQFGIEQEMKLYSSVQVLGDTLVWKSREIVD